MKVRTSEKRERGKSSKEGMDGWEKRTEGKKWKEEEEIKV